MKRELQGLSWLKSSIACVLTVLLVLMFSACGSGGADAPAPISATNGVEDKNNQLSNCANEEAAATELKHSEVDLSELVGFTLLEHDLTDSAVLEPYVLKSPSGEERAVTVIAGGSGRMDTPSHVFWEYWPITILGRLLYDPEGLWFDRFITANRVPFEIVNDIPVSLLHFRVSADNQSASVGMETEMNGEAVIIFSSAQVVPNSDYVLAVELMLWMSLWSQEDTDILEELSQHMGIDLTVYLP